MCNPRNKSWLFSPKRALLRPDPANGLFCWQSHMQQATSFLPLPNKFKGLSVLHVHIVGLAAPSLVRNI